MRFNKQSNGKKPRLLKMISMMVLAFVILIPSFSFAAETSSSTSKVENVVTQPKKLSRTKRSVVASTVPDSEKPTLEGCEFGVYADEDCTHKLDTVVIKKNSDGTYSGVNKGGETLPAGKLYVKELKAATGYKLNTNVYPVNIQAGQEIPLTINNELDVVEPVIAKTSDVQKIKSASLKNPQYVKYTVTMKNPSSTAMVANYVLQDEIQKPNGDAVAIEKSSVAGDINGEAFTSFESITERGFKTNPVVLKPNQTLTINYTVKITGKIGKAGLKNALTTANPVSEVYKIDTSVEHGTIDPSIENIDGGSTKTINYAPDTGYQIKSVTVDDQEVNTANHPASYEFANIGDNHKIHVVYEPAPKVENPTKTFDKQVYHDGDKVESTIVASQTGIEGSVAKNVVIADASNDTLKFDLDSVSAKIVGNHGSSEPVITKDEATGSFRVTIAEFKGGDAVNVKVNGKAITKNEKIVNDATVTALGKTQNVHAEATSVYKIDTKVVNGTITDSMKEIARGSDKDVKYSPKEGYHLKSVTVDGNEVDKTQFENKYSFANITANHKVEVVYEATPSVTDPTKTFDKKEYLEGETVKNEIVVGQNGTEGSVAKNVVISDQNTTSMKIDTDSIKAVIEGSNGTSEPVVAVQNKDNGEFTVTVAEFKAGDKVKITFNGTALNKSAKIDNTAKVVYDGKTKTVTAEAESVYKVETKVVNGTITDSDLKVKHGSDKKIEYAPKEGYTLKSVTVDGNEVDKTQFKSEYGFTNVTANHKIEVVYEGTNAPKIEKHFDKSEYKIGETILNTIIFRNDGVKDAIIKNLVIADQNKDGVKIDTSSIEVNYTGSGNPIVKVIDAATGKFNVLFDEFRGGDQVTIKFKSIFEKNAEKVENDADATGDNIEKITAHAEATPKYEVITEVVNGTISPNVEVKKGENAKIEYAPNDGYKLKKVTVDGKVVTDHPENYDFTNISDNHKIKVEYEAIPRPTITKSFDRANYKVGDVIKATVTVKETGNAGAVSHGVLVTDANQTGFKIKTDTIKATVSKSTERTSSDEPKVTVKDADKGIFEVGLNSIDTSQTLTITYDMEITRESGDIKNKANLKTTEYPKDIPSEATGKVTFDVATKVTGGKITPPVNDVPFGTDVVINYTPDENHYLEKISIDGKEVKTDKIEKSYTFKKIENNHKIEVVYKKLPTPKLEKKSDRADYIKGDVAKYTVTLTNGDALAENVVLKDVFEKEKIDAGVMQLDKDSIKIDGKKVNYAESYNFEKLEAGQKVVLTYEAKVLKDEDNSVRNEASVIAKGMDKEIKVNNTVKIHEIPKLKIEKKSDKKSYKVNEVAKYTITVRNDGKFDAHNVSVKDKFAQEGLMEIQKDTVMVNGKAVSFDKLSVESLKAGDTMTITYSAKVLKDVNAEVVNTATATADYMEYVVDGNGNKVVKNPPTATNKVNIEKTPVKPSLVKTGDATRVLSYGVILLGSALALIITMRKRKAVK